MTEKERYATIGTWGRIFREEGVNVYDLTIRNRLKEAGVIGQTARNKVGRIIWFGFYAESEVRTLCADLLQGLPQANKDNIIEKDGEVFLTIFGFAKMKLGISQQTFKSSLQKGNVQPVYGRSQNGQICAYYPLSEIQRLFVHLNFKPRFKS